jgi:hypothetical protein
MWRGTSPSLHIGSHVVAVLLLSSSLQSEPWIRFSWKDFFEEKYSIIEQNVTTHVVESREPTKAEIYSSWHTFFPTWGTPTPFQTELGPENTVHCIFVHSSSKKRLHHFLVISLPFLCFRANVWIEKAPNY